MREGDEYSNVDWSLFSSKLGLTARHGQASNHVGGELSPARPGARATAAEVKAFRRRPEKGFTHLRDGGEFSDALIHVGPVSFPVHRNILACCSPYFRALFTSPLNATEIGCRELTEGPSVHKGQALSLGYMTDRHDVTTSLKSKLQDVEPGSNISDQMEAQTTAEDTTTNSHLARSPHETAAAYQSPFLQPSGRAFSSSPHPPQLSSIGRLAPQSDFINTMSPTGPAAAGAVPQSRSLFSQHSRRMRPPCSEVCLEDVTSDTMDSIIQHAYGGRVAITTLNVESLLTAADRFQIISLIKECCAFLLSELSVTTCISIIKFSSRFFTCDALRKMATRYLLDNFASVFQTSNDFERLTHQELTAILRADQLNVRHEETVLDAIIKWVLADVANRQECIPGLVKCVRVGLMLPENMREFVDSWLVSSNLSSEFHHVTLQVMEAVLECQKQQITTVDGAMFSPRLPRDILFVIGGSNFGFPLNLVEAVDCRTFQWSVICPYDFAPRSYHGIVALNKDIYVVGGFSGHVYLSSCCKLRADSLTWENVTPMNTKRCYVGAVAVRGSIYTVGGYDGVYRLNSAEKFSTETNQWSFISPMLQQRSDAGVAVLDDKVYVCGGFNGMECIRSVESYDPELDRWSGMPSMPRGRSGLGLAAHKGKLYAVGGFDGVDSAVRLSVMEVFDPETDQWSELEPMFHPRSNLAVEVLEDLLYAIGGYCGDRTTSAVECYDFDTNSWFESGQLSHNRSALGACVVSGLPNTADILQRNGPNRCALVHV